MNACDHAGNPDRQHRLATVCGGSYANVDKAHVEAMVAAVVAAAGSCFGGILQLHAFMPPYTDQRADAPAGYLEFWIERPGASALMFAVEFGGKEHERFGFTALTLAALEEAAANHDPAEYATVANFDELWLFACNVAERLEVTKLELSYGL